MQPAQKHKKAVEFWKNPDAFGLSMLIMFLDTYGTEGLSWLPETIDMELSRDFTEVPEANFSRFMCACSLLASNSFYQSVPDFVRICVELSGTFYPQNQLILPDAQDIAWGMTEAMMIDPPDQNDQDPFSEEIVAFIGQVLDDEGIINAPDVLRIGVRDGDLQARVSYDFSDDPEMFSAISEVELGRTNDINTFVKERAAALFSQIESLPLVNGNTSFIAAIKQKLK